MKQYLLPEKGEFYKANLHSHTTDSDGFFSPSNLVRGYKNAGYSVLAITDHQCFRDRSSLCDKDFIVLNGTEENPAKKHRPKGRCVHIGAIAKRQDITKCPKLFESTDGNFCNSYYTKIINKSISVLNKAGFLTIYNHMRWSLDSDSDLMSYKGFFGMEIYNQFSEILGVDDYNLASYLYALRNKKKLFCMMGDDNHNKNGWEKLSLTGLDHWDTSFGAFNMIKTDDFSYDGIIKALEQGDFYCSTGPEIKEMYIEDGHLYIETSDAVSITISTVKRRGKTNWSRQETITQADFPLDGDEGFVVAVVTDKHGKRAVSQPYFL